MGEMRVPAGALYGAQTARAIENFPISGRAFPRSFLRALGLIKSAAARVNAPHGTSAGGAGRGDRRRRRGSGGGAARRAISAGYLSDRQRHLDQHERQRGDRPAGGGAPQRRRQPRAIEQRRDPHGHAHGRGRGCREPRCFPPCGSLPQRSHARRRSSTASSRSAARTCRTPCRCAWARSSAAMPARWRHARERVEAALPGIYELPLGGTAVGTGLNAPEGFARRGDRRTGGAAPGCRSSRRATISRRRRRATRPVS